MQHRKMKPQRLEIRNSPTKKCSDSYYSFSTRRSSGRVCSKNQRNFQFIKGLLSGLLWQNFLEKKKFHDHSMDRRTQSERPRRKAMEHRKCSPLAKPTFDQCDNSLKPILTLKHEASCTCILFHLKIQSNFSTTTSFGTNCKYCKYYNHINNFC